MEGDDTPSATVAVETAATALVEAKTAQRSLEEVEEECLKLKSLMATQLEEMNLLRQQVASLAEIQATSILTTSAAQETAEEALAIAEEAIQLEEQTETETGTPEPIEALTDTDTSQTEILESEPHEEPEKHGFLRPSRKKERLYL